MTPDHERSGIEPTHGLLMAAGASRRMGQPKALLPFRDSTFVEQLLAHFLAVCETVTIVGGVHAHSIRAVVGERARVVLVPDWSRGMRASLRAGLRHTPPGAVLLTHIDRPNIARSTLQVLVNRPERMPLIPVFRGQRGHPVWIPGWLRQRLLKTDDTPLRDVFARSGYVRVSVDDPGIVENINSRLEYDRLRARERN